MTQPQQIHPAMTMTRVGQKSLRAHNLCLVFSHIAGADTTQPPSRAAISETTGLTKATVSALVATLLEIGLIQELPPIPRQGAGRPAVPLIVAMGRVAALGLEINVDYLGLRAIDLTGMVLEESFWRVNLRQSDPKVTFAELIQRTYDMIFELTNRSVRIIGACLALPGLVDHPQGPLRLAPNLGWLDIDIHKELSDAIATLKSDPIPKDEAVLNIMTNLLVDNIVIDNEANLAARTEIHSQNKQPFIYVSGDVGIGAAIVMDGQVFSGLHGWAGEIGHTVVDPTGPICACGNSGCLETYAGKRSMMIQAGLGIDDNISSLVEALYCGSPTAKASLYQATVALGMALSNAMNLIDVNRIILGGIFADLADIITADLNAEITSRVLSARWVSKDLEIRPASTREYAAATGGALTVLSQAVSDPQSALWHNPDATASPDIEF